EFRDPGYQPSRCGAANAGKRRDESALNGQTTADQDEALDRWLARASSTMERRGLVAAHPAIAQMCLHSDVHVVGDGTTLTMPISSPRLEQREGRACAAVFTRAAYLLPQAPFAGQGVAIRPRSEDGAERLFKDVAQRPRRVVRVGHLINGPV